MTEWLLPYEGYDPQTEMLREALCTVGNGYLGTRGAAPESTAGPSHYPGTYVAGVYNRLRTDVAGHDMENESLVNLPNWLPLTFRVDDGPWFDIDAVQVLQYEQRLDLRRAVLTRRVRFRDERGRTTTLIQRRFAHMGFAHVCALDSTIIAEDWSAAVQIRSLIDGRVRNTLVERYRDLASNHIDIVSTGYPSDDTALLEAQTNQSGIRVAVAARTTLWRGDTPVPAEREPADVEGCVGHVLTTEVRQGEPVRLEKIVTVFTGLDAAISSPAAAAARWLGRMGRFDALLESHVLVWSHLWDRLQFTMQADRDTQRIIRTHVLHLLQTLSPNSEGIDAGIPARGLHGEAYRGHVFWDELFIFPVLNLRFPALTRSLLTYRVRRLPEAREAAREAGYAGAMFPWQSGSTGQEESQQIHLNPRSGHWISDPTQRQRHIGSAIAYNVWHYYQATGDRDFLARHGAEMLIEIARFWASYVTYDPARDRYVIRGVIGPDEFHTGYPGAENDGIDNNAYTNVMAAWVILRAIEALDLLPTRTRRELTERLGLRAEELNRWDHITRFMFVPIRDDGVISQFEGYENLAELDWTAYREKYGNIQRLDRILESEGDNVNRYQVSKQADVLMLFYLLSAEELGALLDHLGYQLHEETIPRTIDYHLARTSHGSTLSAVVHAWILARAHRDRAAEFFAQALHADVTDIQGGTTREGIHLAAMAGSLDLLQRCFAGLETRRDRLILNPYWPRALGVLEFAVQYHEHQLLIRVSDTRAEIRAISGPARPITVACRDETTTLLPGATVRFPSAA